jgi:hypothetical protein
MKYSKITHFLVLTFVWMLVGCSVSPKGEGQSSDPIKQGFLNPPDSARPGVYWYFMDGNTP